MGHISFWLTLMMQIANPLGDNIDTIEKNIYNILIEFGVPMKVVRSIRMCLNYI
jgi:hypothetical protein